MWVNDDRMITIKLIIMINTVWKLHPDDHNISDHDTLPRHQGRRQSHHWGRSGLQGPSLLALDCDNCKVIKMLIWNVAMTIAVMIKGMMKKLTDENIEIVKLLHFLELPLTPKHYSEYGCIISNMMILNVMMTIAVMMTEVTVSSWQMTW